MPNVYISLGVHGFFRDAPTTLFMLLGACSSKLFTQWRHLWYMSQVAETNCVTCSEHSYQHDGPDLALTLWTCL